VINPTTKPKYHLLTGAAPKGDFEEWVKGATEHSGTWWPHWQAWVSGQAPEMVKARKPGGRKLKPIEDAPGSYVRAKA
jgi:polyhydroxyalkanoate synthase